MELRRVRRLIGVWAATIGLGGATALAVVSTPAGATPAVPTKPAVHAAAVGAVAAAAPSVVIGVDNTPPPGKNWEYTHYFPETGVNVPQGSVVLFQWNPGSLNGLHSVTFVPNGQTLAQARAAYPTAEKDTDNGENDTILPPRSNNPSSATCGNSPSAPPCVFDGTTTVSSGFVPNPTGAAFPVQIAPNLAPGTYTYFCTLHPGMSGSINVVPAAQPATSPAAVAAQAASEYSSLTNGAFAAEAAANTPSSTTNADGSHTWKVKVGLSADDVELLEYLPGQLPIHKGDSVVFDGSGTTEDPHTVTTFGAFGNPSTLFFQPPQCEMASGPDTPANPNVQGPPQTGCADPSTFEQPVNFATSGPQLIPNMFTPATATVTGRADAIALGSPTSVTHTFPNNGNYAFICLIHRNMAGVVTTPGYRLGAADGGVFDYGGTDFAGSKSVAGSPVVAMPTTLDGQGYWLVTADGHTYNFGTAANLGNLPVKPAAPIVGGTVGADNGGLYLAGSDGGVYALGDAVFHGSLGGTRLNKPIVAISSDQSGQGYILVGSDGGVFAFGTNGNGEPTFRGSLGGMRLNAPVVGAAMTISGEGYYLVASDGGVFSFGDADFAGSMGGQHLNSPIVGVSVTLDAPSANGRPPGYRLVAADGGVFTFGGASFNGSAGGIHLNSPVIGISSPS